MSAPFNFVGASTKPGGENGFNMLHSGTSLLASSDKVAESIFGLVSSHAPDTRRTGVTQPRLHDAYFREGLELVANTVIDYLANGDMSFVTDRLLPMLHHPDPHIVWKEMSEDSGMMEPEQEGGVPSLKTSSTAEYSAYMMRFGRGMLLSDGFHNTEGGQSLFKRRMAHLVLEIQRTLDVHGLYAIANVQNHYSHVFSNFMECQEAMGASSALDCFERELATFAIMQKSERALYMLDERLRTLLETNGATPDTWLMLPAAMSFCTMEGAETEVYRAGVAEGRRHLNNGKNGMHYFRGSRVHEVHDYTVYGRTLNALKRTRIIGDYWSVRDFGYRDTTLHALPLAQRCQTDVYCCGTDRFENFSLDALLKDPILKITDKWIAPDPASPDADNDNKQRFLGDKDLDAAEMDNRLMLETTLLYRFNLGVANGADMDESPPPAGGGAALTVFDDVEPGYLMWFPKVLADATGHGNRRLGLVHDWVRQLVEAKRYPPEYARVAGKELPSNAGDLANEFYKHDIANDDANHHFRAVWSCYIDALLSFHKGDSDACRLIEGMPYPLSAMCYRPFRRYTMGSAVLMEAGRGTGMTAHAHADVQLQNDAQAKQTFLHFTGNFASVVTNPRRVAVAPDVFCCSYEGGEGHEAVDIKRFEGAHGHLDPMAYARDKPEHAGQSVFVVPGPCLAAANIDGLEFTKASMPLDISGSFRQCHVRDTSQSKTPGVYAMDALYGMREALNIDLPSADAFAAHHQNLHSEVRINSTCFPATQRVPTADGANGSYIQGMDHFGDFIGPGTRQHRNGSGMLFESAAFEEKNISEVR